MIVNGLIVGAAVLLAALAIWGVWLWLGRGEGRHTADALTSDYGTLTYGYVPGERAQIWADRNAGRFDSALDGPANGHSLSGEAGPSTLAPAAAAGPLPPRQTLPPPPALHHDEYGPAQRWHPAPAAAAAPEPPPPPPVTPLHAVTAAAGAVRGMPAGEYLTQLEQATAWEDRGSMWNLLSADTMARGIPAIRVDGDAGSPLSIPPEVVHEMEAGV